MATPDPRAVHVRDAIAVMTAWLAEPDGGKLVGQTAMDIVDERSPGDPAVGLVGLVQGLTGLCGVMLARIEKQTGIPMERTLQDYGRNFADE